MQTPANNSGIRDNHRRGVVADFLKTKIQSGSRLSVVSAYFTIYAYEALKGHLDHIEHLDFLFGEPRFIKSLDPDKTEKKAFILDSNGLLLTNKLQQKRVARECAEWIRQKVDIKSIRHVQLLHGKMYHIANAGVEEAILGSSNFTVRGLGLGNGNNNIELNLEVDSTRDRRDLKAWFDELWNDSALVTDVKQDVLLYLDELYQNHAPEFIYFKTLFHVFENFLAEQDEGGLLEVAPSVGKTEGRRRARIKLRRIGDDIIESFTQGGKVCLDTSLPFLPAVVDCDASFKILFPKTSVLSRDNRRGDRV